MAESDDELGELDDDDIDLPDSAVNADGAAETSADDAAKDVRDESDATEDK